MEAGVPEEGTPKHTDITDACINHILVGPIVRDYGNYGIMHEFITLRTFCKLKNMGQFLRKLPHG